MKARIFLAETAVADTLGGLNVTKVGINACLITSPNTQWRGEVVILATADVGDPTSHKFKVDVVDANGKAVAGANGRFSLEGLKQVVTMHVPLAFRVFAGGMYDFNLYVDGALVDSWPLRALDPPPTAKP